MLRDIKPNYPGSDALQAKQETGYCMNKQCAFVYTPGALYPDGTSDSLKKDDSVPPGGSYTYRWEVKPEFAPTDDDANCLTWVYHSHVDAPKDMASGLIGALLTCKKGMWLFTIYLYHVSHHVHPHFQVYYVSVFYFYAKSIS